MGTPTEKHLRAALLIALAMTATAAGCRAIPEVAPEGATEAATRPAPPPAARVAVDASLTDAATEYATGSAPAAWPAELPFYPASLIESSRVTTSGDLLDMRVSLSTADGLDPVLAWHESMATRHGWAIESSGTLIQDNVEWHYLYLKRRGASANVSIAQQPGGRLVITMATRSW